MDAINVHYVLEGNGSVFSCYTTTENRLSASVIGELMGLAERLGGGDGMVTVNVGQQFDLDIDGDECAHVVTEVTQRTVTYEPVNKGIVTLYGAAPTTTMSWLDFLPLFLRK